MKQSKQQHLLAAIGFTLWALFAVAGIASPAQAHEYTETAVVWDTTVREQVAPQLCGMLNG